MGKRMLCHFRGGDNGFALTELLSPLLFYHKGEHHPDFGKGFPFPKSPLLREEGRLSTFMPKSYLPREQAFPGNRITDFSIWG